MATETWKSSFSTLQKSKMDSRSSILTRILNFSWVHPLYGPMNTLHQSKKRRIPDVHLHPVNICYMFISYHMSVSGTWNNVVRLCPIYYEAEGWVKCDLDTLHHSVFRKCDNKFIFKQTWHELKKVKGPMHASHKVKRHQTCAQQNSDALFLLV